MSEEKKVYGIDLGTTYSVIATLDGNGMPVVIPNEVDGGDLLASAVYFPEGGGNPVVGEAAKGEKDMEPGRVVEFVKRYIGRADAPTYEYDGVKYDPITISSLILKRMVEYAREQGHNVKDVVITCPAYFGNEQEAATKQAGMIAGLNVLNIVHEPTAAAMNYLVHELQENRRVMVYDLGGGTFDITLFDVKVDDDGKALIDVIKTKGDDQLGGIDWDERLLEYMCEKFAYENGTDLADMSDGLKEAIRARVEQTKKDLSRLDNKNVLIKYEGDSTRLELSKQEFEEKTKDLVQRTMDFVAELLSETNLTANDVDVVLLVGGSTLMPMIMKAVEGLFPGKVRREQPNLAVAKGAALYAALQWNEIMNKIIAGDYENANITPPIAESDTGDAVPMTKEQAASQLVAGIEQKNISLPDDKLAYSLGPAVFVEDDNFMVDNLLFVGDTMPAEAEAVYGTRVENAPEIVVNVYENVAGRDHKHVTPCFDQNGNPQYTDPALRVKQIGEVHLQLPPNTPKGSPIQVIFRSSAVGLEVTATNMKTGKSANVTISSEAIYDTEKLEEEKSRFKKIETRGDI